jgi:AcrR family transcriptional regulator
VAEQVFAAVPSVPDAVLDATLASVLAVGVRRTTLTDVARRAGVSRMTLYRMVPDVQTLIMAMLTREFGRLLDDAERAATRRRTARSKLVTVAVEVVRRLPDEPVFRRVIDVDPELLLPYLTDRFGSTQHLAIAHVRELIVDGMRDRSIRRVDPDVLSTALVLATTPFVVSAQAIAPTSREPMLLELERLIDSWLAP